MFMYEWLVNTLNGAFSLLFSSAAERDSNYPNAKKPERETQSTSGIPCNSRLGPEETPLLGTERWGTVTLHG